MNSRTIAIAAALIAATALQGQTAGMRPYPINDPVLQMSAYTLTAPANWVVAGTMLPPSSCGSQSLPVYRAISPDGMEGKYFLPAAEWSWGGTVAPGADCLPIRQVVAARDVVRYLMRQEHVAFVGEAPVPNFAQKKANFTYGYFDEAIGIGKYRVGGRVMEESLDSSVSCQQSQIAVVGLVSSCLALTQRAFAPQGKFEDLTSTFRAMTLERNPAYFQAWQAMMTSNIQNRSRAQTQAMLRAGAIAGQQRMAAHQAYMASAQQTADAGAANFENHEYDKQNNKENEVDFILGCQRAYDSDGHQVTSGNCPNRETPP